MLQDRSKFEIATTPIGFQEMNHWRWKSNQEDSCWLHRFSCIEKTKTRGIKLNSYQCSHIYVYRTHKMGRGRKCCSHTFILTSTNVQCSRHLYTKGLYAVGAIHSLLSSQINIWQIGPLHMYLCTLVLLPWLPTILERKVTKHWEPILCNCIVSPILHSYYAVKLTH